MELAPDDPELIESLQQGQPHAFEQIYRKYVRELLRYTQSRIGSREEAEEIVQDVFVSLWARHEKLHAGIALRPYLFSSVKYKIIRYMRHQQVRKKYAEHFRLFELVYDNLPVEERDPEMIRAFLSRSLAQLPERCRQALNLRLNENLSNSDIAERMRISKSTVENYMAMALKHLKESYKKMSLSD